MDGNNPQALEEIRHIQMLIGRNILVFQNVEHLLKAIFKFGQFTGTEANRVRRMIKIDELSLGRLSDKAVLNKINSKSNAQSDAEYYFSHDFLKDDMALDSAIKFFNNINEDRNFLVHNFTVKFPLDKSESRAKARDWLLSQYEAIFAQREVLVSSHNIIIERINTVSEYFNSDEGKKAWDEFISSEDNQVSFTFSLK